MTLDFDKVQMNGLLKYEAGDSSSVASFFTSTRDAWPWATWATLATYYFHGICLVEGGTAVTALATPVRSKVGLVSGGRSFLSETTATTSSPLPTLHTLPALTT